MASKLLKGLEKGLKLLGNHTDFLIESDDSHAHRLQNLLQGLKRDSQLTETRPHMLLTISFVFNYLHI